MSTELEYGYWTLSRIQAALELITYKPGWELAVVDAPKDGFRPMLELRHTQPKRDDPDRQAKIAQRVGVPHHFRDLDDFACWVRVEIHIAEIHESDEWFLWRGERIFDPHRTGERIKAT